MTLSIPRTTSTLARTDRTLSGYVSIPVLEKMYSVMLWDTDTGEVFTSSEYDVSDTSDTVEHFFTVPPKAISMKEPFSTHIQTTQSGGVYSEGHGSLIKQINVSGTTGVRPHKKNRLARPAPGIETTASRLAQAGGQAAPAGSTTPTTARASAIGLEPSEITGHDSVMSLRNVFRLYSDLQVQGNTSVVMVWRNAKDDDFWIVEPKDFSLSQDSHNPFGYKYDFILQTMARFDKSLLAQASPPGSSGGTDPQRNLNSREGFSDRLRKVQKTLTNGYFVTVNSAGLIDGGITAVNKIIKPMSAVIRGIKSNVNGLYGAADKLVRATMDLSYELTTAINNLGDIGRSLSVRRLARHWRRSLIACFKILTEDVWKATFQQFINQRTRISRAYTVPGFSGAPQSPNTGGSPTFLANNPHVNQVASHVVGASDDIRSLAGRLLGDPRRWQELVVLNKLKPPYVNNTAGIGVLGPGDLCLYPKKGGGDTNNMIKLQDSSGQDYDNLGSSESTGLLDQTYGRDLRLKYVNVGAGQTLADIEVNNRGDLSTIVGVENVDQAINIKFSTERGTLKMHPYFGARFAIGSKATTTSFNNFRLNTLATLLSDDRIDEVKSINFVTVGDVLFVDAQIKLINSKDYTNTHFALRRF